ncbi:MAG: ribose-phosphate pyrophosphokinase [bacterium]
MSRFRDFRIYSGNSNPVLAEDIAGRLDDDLGELRVDSFADGEVRTQFTQTVRGMDVFLTQSTCRPVNDNLMELLLMIDAAHRASAARVTAIIPYFGYARQDRKDRPRVPISAKLVANLLEEAGADRILTMHLHADQIQGFFDIPVDHLYSAPVIIDHLKSCYPGDDSVIVSPDAGAANRSRALAKRLDFDLAIIDKRRPEPNLSEVVNIIGDVEGKNCILVDDMIDTGGTLCQGAQALADSGARSVVAVATHPVFSGPAIERIEDSALEKVFVCDTIPLENEADNNGKIEILSTGEMFAKAVRCIHEEQSIKQLFV